MIAYIILLIFIVGLPIIKINRKQYCIIIGIIMTILVGFRSIKLGMNDTSEIYLPMYNILSKLSFYESYIFLNEKNYEIGFYLLTRIFIMIFNNFRLYLIILALPINIIVARFIYKNSKIPFLSFLIYFSLNYFALSFTGLRHCVALAILLSSYKYIEKRKLKLFIVMVLIASFFHKTSLIFLIAYPLANIKVGYKNFIAIFVSLGFSKLLGKNFLKILIDFIGISRYETYINATEDTLTFFFINLLLLIGIMLITSKQQKQEMKQMINMYTIGICLSTASVFIREAFRLSTYFTIYSIVLIPNAISLINIKKMKPFIIFVFCVMLIMYFFCFSMGNNRIYPYLMDFSFKGV